MSKRFRLTYFASSGRAEPIRIAFHIAGIALEDVRLDHQTFRQRKEAGDFPLGQLPILEIDDDPPYCQSPAILRYVAGLVGDEPLYPRDPLKRLVVDSAMDTFNDTLSRAMSPSYHEQDPEKKLAMRRAFVADQLAKGCSYVERLIDQHGGPFLTGEDLTIGDLLVGGSINHYLSGKLDGITQADFAPYQRLLVLASAYGRHPQVASYHAQRGAA